MGAVDGRADRRQHDDQPDAGREVDHRRVRAERPRVDERRGRAEGGADRRVDEVLAEEAGGVQARVEQPLPGGRPDEQRAEPDEGDDTAASSQSSRRSGDSRCSARRAATRRAGAATPRFTRRRRLTGASCRGARGACRRAAALVGRHERPDDRRVRHLRAGRTDGAVGPHDGQPGRHLPTRQDRRTADAVDAVVDLAHHRRRGGAAGAALADHADHDEVGVLRGGEGGEPGGVLLVGHLTGAGLAGHRHREAGEGAARGALGRHRGERVDQEPAVRLRPDGAAADFGRTSRTRVPSALSSARATCGSSTVPPLAIAA